MVHMFHAKLYDVIVAKSLATCKTGQLANLQVRYIAKKIWLLAEMYTSTMMLIFVLPIILL